MKYCSKCGKQLMDEAVICPSCGDYVKKHTNGEITTNDSAMLKEYVLKAKCVKILGIIAALLCCGIGIIFSIAIWCIVGGVNNMQDKINPEDPREIAEFEKAKRNMALGKKLSVLPSVVLVVCIVIIAFKIM